MMKVRNLRDKPMAAFVISLIGGIIGLLYSAIMLGLLSIGSHIISSQMNHIAPGYLSTAKINQILGFLFGILAWFLISSILLITGALMMYKGDPKRVRTGAIMSIVFGILNFGNCSFIPLILGIIGGALGLIWSTRRKSTLSPPEGGGSEPQIK